MTQDLSGYIKDLSLYPESARKLPKGIKYRLTLAVICRKKRRQLRGKTGAPVIAVEQVINYGISAGVVEAAADRNRCVWALFKELN